MTASRAADARAEREKRFFDEAELDRDVLDRVVYAITSPSEDFLDRSIRERVPGAKVLELGCGWGEKTLQYGRWGAEAIGVDVSTTRIDHAKAQVPETMFGSARYHVMRAEELELPDDEFDVVCGRAVLHHLDLPRALPEMVRVLKPDGVAVFVEPLGHNPAINLFRRLTPGFRTPDERPLRMSDVGGARTFFDDVELRFFYLAALLAVPFRGLPFFPALVGRLHTLDQAVFTRVPHARKHAWQIGIVLASPRKPQVPPSHRRARADATSSS